MLWDGSVLWQCEKRVQAQIYWLQCGFVTLSLLLQTVAISKAISDDDMLHNEGISVYSIKYINGIPLMFYFNHLKHQ